VGGGEESGVGGGSHSYACIVQAVNFNLWDRSGMFKMRHE
jgi:hypothetical protein